MYIAQSEESNMQVSRSGARQSTMGMQPMRLAYIYIYIYI